MFTTLIRPAPNRYKLFLSLFVCLLSCFITWYGQLATNSTVSWALMTHSAAHLLTGVVFVFAALSPEFNETVSKSPPLRNTAPLLLAIAGSATFVKVMSDVYSTVLIRDNIHDVANEFALTWTSFALITCLLLEKKFLPELHELEHSFSDSTENGRLNCNNVTCVSHASYDLEIKFDLVESFAGLVVAGALWMSIFSPVTVFWLDTSLAFFISVSMIVRACILMKWSK